jgi:hypothetical protein
VRGSLPPEKPAKVRASSLFAAARAIRVRRLGNS